MVEAIGLSTIALQREAIGNLTLEGLNKGEWRYLTKEEIDSLM